MTFLKFSENLFVSLPFLAEQPSRMSAITSSIQRFDAAKLATVAIRPLRKCCLFRYFDDDNKFAYITQIIKLLYMQWPNTYTHTHWIEVNSTFKLSPSNMRWNLIFIHTQIWCIWVDVHIIFCVRYFYSSFFIHSTAFGSVFFFFVCAKVCKMCCKHAMNK